MNKFSLEKIFREQKLLCDPMSPIDYFKAKSGIIWQPKDEVSIGTYSIELDLEPFLWGDEEVNTNIRLDFIDLKNLNFNSLSYKTFYFPTNPEDGYIDGSIYLESRHNPIYVTLISFGMRYKELFDKKINSQDYIVATLLYKFCWEGEDDDNYPETKRINVVLEYKHTRY